MSDGPEWFASKRYGMGPGAPIAWQGWVVAIGFVAIVAGLSLLLHSRPAALVASVILPTIIFLVIAGKTTRGGWRWRWGEKE
jgi:hypothetical protein